MMISIDLKSKFSCDLMNGETGESSNDTTTGESPTGHSSGCAPGRVPSSPPPPLSPYSERTALSRRRSRVRIPHTLPR